MASGYTRQAAANIAAGLTIQSADLNAEYNQIQSAFDGTTGHDHTGGSGLAPKISLTAAVSGILPMANGGSGASSFTSGSVLFSNGTAITQDNSSFFWNEANTRLGIGTASPVSNLHIHKTLISTIRVTNSTSGATANDGFIFQIDSTGAGYVWNYENHVVLFGTNNLERVRINADGNVSIGNTNDSYKLDITGDVNISGTYRIAGVALSASMLSNGVTGTGAVMLAASPTTTGTLNAAAITASGAVNSNSLGVTVNATIGGSVITTNAVVGGTLNVTGASTLGVTSTGNLTTTGTHSVSGALSANSASLSTALPIASGGTSGTTVNAAFQALVSGSYGLTNPGYIKLQNGLILNWGTTTIAALVVNFPFAFPGAVLASFATGSDINTIWAVTNVTLTQITLNAAGSPPAQTINWFVIGV